MALSTYGGLQGGGEGFGGGEVLVEVFVGFVERDNQAWGDGFIRDGLFGALEDSGKADVEEDAGRSSVDERIREVTIANDLGVVSIQALLKSRPRSFIFSSSLRRSNCG